MATASPGTFALEDPLERGDSYAAEVYFPRPGPRELAAAGADYPQLSSTYWTLGIQATRRAQALGMPLHVDVRFAPFGSAAPPVVSDDFGDAAGVDATGLLRDSEYARSWALARRLARRSRTPYEYARRILAYLGTGFAYSEGPARHAVPLEAFLFGDRVGYCQHFSGAMALLLRMGGVPARVVGGFSPGAYSRKRRDYVVRDIDAHSWVEAWFPGYGWVTFDPTPVASPARSQLVNVDLPRLDAPPGAGAQARRGDVPEPGPRTAGGAEEGGGSGSPWLLLPALLLPLGLAGGWWALRRRGGEPAAPPEADLSELRRALRRAGRPLTPPTTLAELEGMLGRDDYLAALRARRFGFGAPPPTRAHRQALRRRLARDAGRLRALWALPPRPGR